MLAMEAKKVNLHSNNKKNNPQEMRCNPPQNLVLLISKAKLKKNSNQNNIDRLMEKMAIKLMRSKNKVRTVVRYHQTKAK
jgi:hypothetical protein